MKSVNLKKATEKFIAHLEEAGKKPSTIGTSRRTLALLTDNMGDEKQLDKILAVHISKFFNGDTVMEQPGKNGPKPRAEASIQQIRRITRQFIFWCVSQGYIEKAPLPKDEARLGEGLQGPHQSREEVASQESAE